MENSTESKATPELTLTLTPELDDAPAPVLSAKPVEELAKSEGDLALDDSMLSDDEKKMVEEFSEQINVRDSAAIMQYGAGAQKKMADFSESALERVRTNDLGEVGDLITGVVNELRGFNATEEKGLFGFFKRGVDKVQSLRTRYNKAEANVNKIVDQLKDHQMTLVKDAATLDKMYELNLTYFKELTMYLLAGKKKLAQVREGELVELVQACPRHPVAPRTLRLRRTSRPCAHASRRSLAIWTSLAPSPCRRRRRSALCRTTRSRSSRKSRPPS